MRQKICHRKYAFDKRLMRNVYLCAGKNVFAATMGIIVPKIRLICSPGLTIQSLLYYPLIRLACPLCNPPC